MAGSGSEAPHTLASRRSNVELGEIQRLQDVVDSFHLVLLRVIYENVRRIGERFTKLPSASEIWELRTPVDSGRWTGRGHRRVRIRAVVRGEQKEPRSSVRCLLLECSHTCTGTIRRQSGAALRSFPSLPAGIRNDLSGRRGGNGSGPILAAFALALALRLSQSRRATVPVLALLRLRRSLRVPQVARARVRVRVRVRHLHPVIYPAMNSNCNVQRRTSSPVTNPRPNNLSLK